MLPREGEMWLGPPIFYRHFVRHCAGPNYFGSSSMLVLKIE